jgi:transposase
MPRAFQWTSEELEDMVTSYQQGESAQSIAKRYGTSYQVIQPVLRKREVQLRSALENRYGHHRHVFDARYF